jgi:chemotaxis protein histidine kinase CheA
MEELKKINRIIDNKAGECSREILLVLDATTGQNAVNQAKLFSETAPITGIVLTKLDGTAKGGIVISIKNELGIPVKLIGVGEKIDDLQPFDSNMFVDALFTNPELKEEAEEETAEENEDEAEENEETSEYSEYVPDNEAESENADEEYEEVSEVSENVVEAEETEDEEEQYEEPAEAVTYADETESDEADSSDVTEEESGKEKTDEEAEEKAEEEPEAVPEPEKKKKRGFFSRLFGGKNDD